VSLDRAKKLLAYALNPAATEAEMVNAATKAVAAMKAAGMTADDVLGDTASGRTVNVREVRVPVYRVPPESFRMPFGKYRGKTLAEVFTADPPYIRWFVNKATSADPIIVNAARQLLEVSSRARY
jgi:hypothetical protein